MTNGLVVNQLSTGYGNMEVVHQIDMNIEKGSVTCLLGRNGVGKSTFLKSVIGVLPRKNGEIEWKGESLKKLKTYELKDAGIVYVPQDKAIFPSLTVEQNLRLVSKSSRQFNKKWESIVQFFPVLNERFSQQAGTLSGGEQKMLLMARALLTEAELILIDEVSEGVQPSVVNTMADVIKKLNKELGTTVLIVEQNLDFALSVANQYYVMDRGTIVANGEVGESSKGEISSYLTL